MANILWKSLFPQLNGTFFKRTNSGIKFRRGKCLVLPLASYGPQFETWHKNLKTCSRYLSWIDITESWWYRFPSIIYFIWELLHFALLHYALTLKSYSILLWILYFILRLLLHFVAIVITFCISITFRGVTAVRLSSLIYQVFFFLQVYFEGQRGGDYRGDIAIDDIAFKDCPSTLPPSTIPPSTIPPSTPPPSTPPPSTMPPTTLPPTTLPPTQPAGNKPPFLPILADNVSAEDSSTT